MSRLLVLCALLASFSASAEMRVVRNIQLKDGRVEIYNVKNTIYDGGEVRNDSGHCIHVVNSSNIVIRNIRLRHCFHTGIAVDGPSDHIVIENNRIDEATAGIAVNGADGTINYVTVRNNKIAGIWKGAPFADNARGQCVLFMNLGTAKGMNITGNNCQLAAGVSNPEDMISIQNSSGSSASPITISGNCLKGNTSISSTSGSCIAMGDTGGSYQTAIGNTCLITGRNGIFIAGGTNNKILGNKIYSPQTSVSNQPMYVWDQTSPTQPCSGHILRDNKVYWFDGVDNPGTRQTGFFNGANCGTVTDSGNDYNVTTLATADCPAF